VSTLGNRPNDAILVFTPTGTESTFATGLNNPHGLAFDAAGNLFVAETRARLRTGEMRIFDSTGKVERVIAFDDANRRL